MSAWLLVLCLTLPGCSGGLVQELLETPNEEQTLGADVEFAQTVGSTADEGEYTETTPQADGLLYELISDGSAYRVIGIGDCCSRKLSFRPRTKVCP